MMRVPIAKGFKSLEGRNRGSMDFKIYEVLHGVIIGQREFVHNSIWKLTRGQTG